MNPDNFPADDTSLTPVVPSAACPGAEDEAPAAAAAARFQSCRWRRPAEDGSPECCSHRDVLPLAGTKGFNASAWCPDCGYYKLRRNPRKNAQPETPSRF
jgi:hypothetical protein